MESIVLVTSIAPRGIQHQKIAIESWLSAGFRVVSCNHKDELQAIQKDFPDVEFVEMVRDARALMGKPCPYIFDMLQVVKEKAGSICGIINSDIYIKNLSKEMYEFIYVQAKEQVLFLHRNDVNGLDDIEKMDFKMYFGGIDAFFFHRDIVDILEDDGLVIGQAMWDYWLPLTLSLKGIRIREFLNPIIFHIKHDIQWSDNFREEICNQICRKYYKNIQKRSWFYLIDEYIKLLSDRNIGISFATEEIRRRKVLIIGTKSFWMENEYTVDRPLLKKAVTDDVPEREYDYCIEVPDGIILNSGFIDVCLWSMENYNVSNMRVLAYVRGNSSKIIRKYAFCERELLSHKIYALKVYKKREKPDSFSGKMYTGHICSVLVEESPEIIWKYCGFKGRVFVYPAGEKGREWIRKYKNISKGQISIQGFIDASKDIQNTTVEGYRVYSPDKIFERESYDFILIASDLYGEEIYESLRQHGQEDCLIIWDELKVNYRGCVIQGRMDE